METFILYVSPTTLNIHIKKIWILTVFLKSSLSGLIGEYLFKPTGWIIGVSVLALLLVYTIYRKFEMEFSDKYEDYVEDNAYEKNIEVWVRKKL